MPINDSPSPISPSQDSIKHEYFMRMAIEQARIAAQNSEVPIGAIIVDDEGELIATGFNQPIMGHDPSAHAEIIALRNAAKKLENYRLKPNLTLYVTLEPCTMCAGAISFARVKNLVFGAYDKKGGAVEHGAQFYSLPTCHHRPNVVGGILENECAQILKEFFAAKRA